MTKNTYTLSTGIHCLLVAIIIVLSKPILAAEIINAYENIAMDGFDVVAYFEQRAPLKGDATYGVDYKGKRWIFSSAQNVKTFQQNPSAFEPQFNGWCAYAVSEGYGAEVDFINGWAVLDNKLYLNWDAETRDLFTNEQVKRKVDAQANWQEVHKGLHDGSTDFYTHKQENVNISHPQKP